MAANWSLTESNPAVFSAILWDLGVTGVQVEELYALDPSLIETIKPIYAFIFLFKWRDASKEPPLTGSLKTPPKEHYFALQTITNACATIALLNAVMNMHGQIGLGPELEGLKSFSEGMDPETRGHILTNVCSVSFAFWADYLKMHEILEPVREAPKSSQQFREEVGFAFNQLDILSEPRSHLSDPFALEDLQRDDDEREDAFHFVTYLPIGDELYEFDGLKHSPVSHGSIPGGATAWIPYAIRTLETRMGSYEGGVHFSLMAICGDRLKSINEQITQTQSILTSVADESARSDCNTRLAQLQMDNQDELDKRASWAFENKLRRHNLTGFAVALLSELAKAGKLDNQIEEAKRKTKNKREAAKIKGKA